MSNELDIIHDGEIAETTPRPGTAAAAMDMLREHAEMMDMAYKLADSMVGTSMVPKIYQRKSERDKEAAHNATAAILYGLELGLNPIQSLQQVFPVHGQPSIYAKTMVALLKSKGYKFKTVEAGPERCTVSGWWPGEEPETSTWDIERATKAGFVPTIDPETGKYKTKKFSGPNGSYEKLIGNEKYLTQPEDMLWAKAAATVCRRLAPDVLLGISHTVEDFESEPDPEPIRATAQRMDAPTYPGARVVSVPPEIQQWSDKAASNEGAKPDTAQADDGSTPVVSDGPPQNPESDSADAPAKSTRTQQQHISRQLEKLGATEKGQKLAYLATFFKREFTTVAGLSRAEADEVIDELDRQVAVLEARDAGGELDSVAEATDTAGAEQAAGGAE